MYIDVVWFLNFCFDALLLLWTSLILKQKIIKWRIAVGGLIGSATVWLFITPFSYLLDNFFIKVAVSLLMVLINSRLTWRKILQYVCTFYLVTFLAGGLLFGLHNLLNSSVSSDLGSAHSNINLYGDRISWLFVIVAFPLTYILVKLFASNVKLANFFQHQIISAVCQINEMRFEIDGLVDTGNQLIDPVSRAPVVIVSLKGSQAILLPQGVIEMMEKGLVTDAIIPIEWQRRMRVIPYKVVGSDSNVLFAFKPDFFEINQQRRNCLISFTKQKLSSVSHYNAIIHPDLVG